MKPNKYSYTNCTCCGEQLERDDITVINGNPMCYNCAYPNGKPSFTSKPKTKQKSKQQNK